MLQHFGALLPALVAVFAVGPCVAMLFAVYAALAPDSAALTDEQMSWIACLLIATAFILFLVSPDLLT